MLNGSTGLQVGVDLCGGGSYEAVSRDSQRGRSRDLPAAAAGSSPVPLFSSAAGE